MAMKSRTYLLFAGFVVVAVLSASLALLWASRRGDQHDLANGGGHKGHIGHGEENEAEGGHQMSLDEIAATRCEHDMLTYLCEECRYEVGVVKLSPSLIKEGARGGNGLIRTEDVTRRRVTPSLDVTGGVQLNENVNVHISPRISGIIESVEVDIGATVERGDVLFSINSVELGKALSAYERSRALATLSEKNFEREKSLFERRIASEQDMIAAQMAYEQHRTELKAAEQTLHVLGLTEEDLAGLKEGVHGTEIGRLPVHAPIDGTIIEKHAVVGELVEPGKDVMLLADLSTVWVWADIYEVDLLRLLKAEKQGPIPVEVFVLAFPERPFHGRVDYVGATMAEKTRTVKVRATVQNEEGLLRPGMFCEIRIGVSNGEEVLAIPKIALLSDEGCDFVFMQWKEDFYVRRLIKRGREFFDSVEVLEGLNAGDTIVADGAFLLKSDVLREKMGAGCAD
jgi:cobalt-zinc-cadmium efflux system membrane fusion protein